MYVPPAFKRDDLAALDFVAERAFGTLIAVDGGMPVATHVPLFVDQTANGLRLETHVARANPLHEIVARSPRVLVTVQGPDAYISPDWYVSKDQVPTWNYIAVHLSGTAVVIAPDGALGHVDRLSDQHEARLFPKPIWRSTKMTPEKRDMMVRAIVCLEVRIETIEASWKLGQHKPLPDQIAVAQQLASRAEHANTTGGSTSLGRWMAERSRTGG